jgi:hypothetical protein
MIEKRCPAHRFSIHVRDGGMFRQQAKRPSRGRAKIRADANFMRDDGENLNCEIYGDAITHCR